MKRIKVIMVAFLSASLLILSTANIPAVGGKDHPLCVSQFALVNHACAKVISFPPPPQLPPDLVFPEADDHGQGHRHRHRHSALPVEDECCRWLINLDDECVCDLLVRLPVSLSKTKHSYNIIVNDACNVTYSCPGRIKP